MTDKVVLYDVADGVATITLNRVDKLNALNWEVINGVDEAFNNAESDENVKAVVITGNGRAFSVGDDLEQAWAGDDFKNLMQRFKDRPEEPEFDRPYDYTKPVIAAINGYCFAGAIEFILWADIIIAADDAKFATQFVQHGLVAGSQTFYRLPRAIGPSNASYMLLTGERIDATQAQQMGLVTKVVPRDELVATAQAIAKTIAAYPEHAVRGIRDGIKTSIRATREGQREMNVFSNTLLVSVFERLGLIS